MRKLGTMMTLRDKVMTNPTVQTEIADLNISPAPKKLIENIFGTIEDNRHRFRVEKEVPITFPELPGKNFLYETDFEEDIDYDYTAANDGDDEEF